MGRLELSVHYMTDTSRVYELPNRTTSPGRVIKVTCDTNLAIKGKIRPLMFTDINTGIL